MMHSRTAGFWNRVVIEIDDVVQIGRNNLDNIMQLPKIIPFPQMKEGSAMEARLHTAVWSGEEYSIISMQRLDDCQGPFGLIFLKPN